MLTESDLLLTLSALFLLNAALHSPSRVTRASASELSAYNGNNEATRKSEADIDLLMYKVRKSLEGRRTLNEQQQQQLSITTNRTDQQHQFNREDDSNHNSYNYYANQTSQQAAETQQLVAPAQTKAHRHHAEPQEVKVKFLRTSSSPSPTWPSGAGELVNGVAAMQTNNNPLDQADRNTTVYLLNYALPAASSDDRVSPANEIQVGEEQQQRTPFAVFPPFNQPQAGAQQQAVPPNLPENIRNILNNYQRYPQAAGGLDPRLLQQLALQQQRALSSGSPGQAGLEPSNPAANSAPAQAAKADSSSRAPGLNSAQQQQQQPQQQLSPLQILTAPFQAFLPALGGPGAPAADGQAKPPPSGGSGSGPANANLPQQPFSLFNPFGIGNQPQQQQGQQQVPPLQALYQQLPLYQALLAVRQRQEAMQAAQKMRQQQQLQNNHLTQPSATRRPVPYGGHQAQQPQQQQPLQPLQPLQPTYPGYQQPANPGLWPPPPQQQQQQPQVNAPIQPQVTPVAQHGNQQNAVQFDDDNANNNNAPNQSHDNNHGNAQTNQNQNDNNHNEPQQNNAQADNNNNNGDEGSNEQQDNNNNNNNNGPNDNQSNNNQEAKPEEEDPDLKQFQNLANGGDSFTDLFPPGILSNNDINDIKKQQEEQAKKQEEEERQRQLQQQQQQHQQQNSQPINQFSNETPQQQQQQQNNEPPNQNGASDANNQDDNNGSNEGAGNGEENGPDQDDGGNPDEPGEEGGGGERAAALGPVAAALTSKATTGATANNGNSDTQPAAGKSERFKQSPGVVYV